MIRYRLGGIVPRVRNHKGVAVRLERIPEGYLPGCKPTFTGLHFDIQPRCWAREEDIPDTGKNTHSLELCSCARVTVAAVRAMVDGSKLRVFCRHQAYPSNQGYLLPVFKMFQVRSSTSYRPRMVAKAVSICASMTDTGVLYLLAIVRRVSGLLPSKPKRLTSK